jgi:hypothetical protein
MPFSPLALQAEVAEAILKKVAGLCDEVDVLCRMHEEDIAGTIIALHVWGEPKYDVTSESKCSWCNLETSQIY